MIEVVDDGRGVRRRRGGRSGRRTSSSEGGLGIAIIRALADELEIGARPDGQRLAAPLRETPELAAELILATVDRSNAARTMLQLVNVGHKSLADYATIASRGLMDEIRRLAEPLQGKRVVHLSATAFGGGVAEINYTLVPLMATPGSTSSGGSSRATTSSSTSRRRSTTRSRATRRA